MAVGDFNHDGNLDIVTAINVLNPDGVTFTGLVSVLLGVGDGTFQPATTYVVGNSPIVDGNDPVSVAVGDFNHDGNLDIVTANAYSNTVSGLCWAERDGTFQPATTYAKGNKPCFRGRGGLRPGR